MISEQESQISKSKFYSYWDEIDDIKLLAPSDFKKIRQQIRNAIIKVLTKGLEDRHKGKKVIRRVLSANEIQIGVQNLLGLEVKKANLYFHLQVLEEIQAIEIVGNLALKKKLVSYYGKTAKAFLLTGQKEKPELDLLSDINFLKFLSYLNPNVSNSDIKNILTSIAKIEDHDTSVFVNWMDKYGELLKDQDIDFIAFYKLITFLKIENPDVKNATNKLSELLKLEKI
jgi:hypothetical protein